jgi:hypothetical protein
MPEMEESVLESHLLDLRVRRIAIVQRLPDPIKPLCLQVIKRTDSGQFMKCMTQGTFTGAKFAAQLTDSKRLVCMMFTIILRLTE